MDSASSELEGALELVEGWEGPGPLPPLPPQGEGDGGVVVGFLVRCWSRCRRIVGPLCCVGCIVLLQSWLVFGGVHGAIGVCCCRLVTLFRAVCWRTNTMWWNVIVGIKMVRWSWICFGGECTEGLVSIL